MNQSEYFKQAREFRGRMKEEFQKPVEERSDSEPWMHVPAESICRNEKCPVYGIVFNVNVGENVDGVYRVVCGRCSTWVWDLTPIFDDGPGEKLPVHLPENAASNSGAGER